MSTIPPTARAAAIVEYGKPLQHIDVKIPQTLEPGSILVKVTMATVCASDVHIADGDAGAVRSAGLPRIPGHEMTGRIAALGPGVTHDSVGTPLEVGDRIIWTHGFCGQCYECVALGQSTLCRNMRTYMTTPATEYPYLTGGFSEYCYVFPSSGRIKVPDEIPDALAAAAGCALRTVMNAFDLVGTIDDRDTIVIQGSGPLGLFATARAVRSAARQVIVIGGPASRLEIAKQWGATQTIDITVDRDPEVRRNKILEWTDGRGADVAIEVAGVPSAFTEGVELLRQGGRYAVVGALYSDEVAFKPALVVTRGLKIFGSKSASVQHYYRALQFLVDNRHRFDWSTMISNTYPFSEVNRAMDGMRSLTEVKPAISFP